jgi:hypothetical protein
VIILQLGMALIGAATTIVVLLPYGVGTALVAAPFGGSLSVLMSAVLINLSKD